MKRFFGTRCFGRNVEAAVRTARRWEANNFGKAFTFLTVTNKGAHALNRRCLQLHLGLSSDELDEKMAKINKKAYVRRARQEWRDDGDTVDVPMPESVFAPPPKGSNDAIR